MTKVQVYTKETCPHCVGAKGLLKTKGIPFEEIDAEQPGVFAEVFSRTQHKTVPQIFINGDFVGGYSELQGLEKTGELDARLGIMSVAPQQLSWE